MRQRRLIILGPADADWTSVETSNLHADDVEAITGLTDLTRLYTATPGAAEEGPFASSYTTTYGAGNETALIEYVSGLAITCPECILVAKDGAAKPVGTPPPAQYLFDIGTWNGTESISLVGLWPAQGSFSHITIFGAPGETISTSETILTSETTTATLTSETTQATVTPEPATLALLGSGLAITAARLRRRKKV